MLGLLRCIAILPSRDELTLFTRGLIVHCSLHCSYWVDETLAPNVNPLQPASAEGKAAMKALVEKYTSGPCDVQSVYKYLQEESPSKREENKAHLLAAYAEMARDIAKSGGPFLMGQQFTLADVALISFVQRAFVLLGHYQEFKVPQNDQLKVGTKADSARTPASCCSLLMHSARACCPPHCALTRVHVPSSLLLLLLVLRPSTRGLPPASLVRVCASAALTACRALSPCSPSPPPSATTI